MITRVFKYLCDKVIPKSLPLSGGVGGGLLGLLFLLLGGLLCSCSETIEDEEEFANWQTVNDDYFEGLYNSVKQGQKGEGWKIFRSWTMPADSEMGYTERAKDCIVVKVLEEGAEQVSPFYTDTVRCHYEGRLLPSLNYKDGYKFDSSYEAPFNADYATPAKFLNSGLVFGFTTALMNMHRGDHWLVYIPYQLGYGETQTSGSSIPAYSTLVFEIRLVDFWRPISKEPTSQAADDSYTSL